MKTSKTLKVLISLLFCVFPHVSSAYAGGSGLEVSIIITTPPPEMPEIPAMPE